MNRFSVTLHPTWIIFIFALGISACKTINPVDPNSQTFDEVIAAGGTVDPIVETNLAVESMEQDSTINGQAWKCTTTDYSIEKGATDFFTLNPLASIIYPGAMLQGATLAEATPSPIVVERAGGTISFDLNNGSQISSFRVSQVRKSEIQDAMNRIIGASPDTFPAGFEFSYEAVQSERQMAFNMNINYENQFAEVSSDIGFSKNQAYSRYLVKLTQQYYTMSFDLPTSYDSLFATGVTPADLERYVGMGNPATYISDVTYGRIFYMLIESSESETAMSAAINGSFGNVVAKGGVGFEANHLQSLKDLRVKVIAFGGESGASLDIIGETDLSTLGQKLRNGNSILAGKPISYIVRSAYNNEIVKAKLATEYSVKDCKPALPGLFDFLNIQSSGVDINPGYDVLHGDVNGDQIEDIILNATMGNTNMVQVALGSGSGFFNFQNSQTLVNSFPQVGSWTDFGVKTGDINGDGLTDLVWSNIISTPVSIRHNLTYFALAKGDGSYEMSPNVLDIEASWGTRYRFFVGDLDGDGKDDMIWNALNTINRTYTALSNGNGFDFDLARVGDQAQDYLFNRRPVNGWSTYQCVLGDANGDGRVDLFFEQKNTPAQRVYIATASDQEPGKLKWNPYYDFGNVGFDPYQFAVGDVNGDGRDDVINADTRHNRSSGTNPIWVGFSNGVKINSKKLSSINPRLAKSREMNMTIADFNLDGKEDIVWTEMTDSCMVHLGLVRADVDALSQRIYSFATAEQRHPNVLNWRLFQAPFAADVNGDRKPDLVWIKNEIPINIAVALAH